MEQAAALVKLAVELRDKTANPTNAYFLLK
jgi:hypothetical protein